MEDYLETIFPLSKEKGAIRVKNIAKRLMEFVQSCPRAGPDWLEYFDEFCQHGLKPEKCAEHLKVRCH
jgi:hypothetical protein